MKYTKLGRTGLVVSKLCLGTMTFGGQTGFWKYIGKQQQDEADELVRTAFNAGINFFDTADVYSAGISEKMLGEAIRNNNLPRDEIVVATKVFGRVSMPVADDAADAIKAEAERREKEARNISGLSRKHIMDGVEKSLDRLGLDYIDLYQVHGTDPLTPIEETVEALDLLIRHNKVRYVGLCNMPAWLIMKAIAYAREKGLHRFESCQMYYSIAGRDLEREVVPLAKDQDLAILPWSPLAGGFLSGKFTRDSEGPNDARRTVFDFPPIDKEKGYDIVDAMRELAEAKGITVPQVALGWLLHQPHVTSVIIGARTLDQLKDNLGSVDVEFSFDELQKLNEISALTKEYPGWMLERQQTDRQSQIDD
ncbi:MAG: aldo/keto reductase [Henriciella sp.]|uniref:aldo/keto reductase n=1 Tax=Henriciella sp. TaxID=1968823 RepID=UPI0032EF53BE